MLAKNLRYLRKKRGWTQGDVAKRIGKSVPAVNKWEIEENNPSMKVLPTLANLFGVTIEDLMSTDLEKKDAGMLSNLENISTPAAYGIPVLGTICCGDGIECIEDYRGIFFVDNSIRADLCLDIKGNSMIDAGIKDGDKAFLLKNCSYINGRIYGVVIGDSQTAILRKIYWQDEKLILQPCNDFYEPIITTEEETRIIGECVGFYHPMT